MLDPHITTLIEQCFSPEDQPAAAEMVENYKAHWPVEDHRCKIAVIKLSEGLLPKLAEAISLGEWDLRDLLSAAGLAEDTEAHLSWKPKPK